MKAYHMIIVTLMAVLASFASADECSRIQFNPSVGIAAFEHQPQAPYLAVGDVADAIDTYQSCSVTLRARHNNTYGISGGAYQKKYSDDGGKTWSANWTDDTFAMNAPTATAEWKKGNNVIPNATTRDVPYQIPTSGNMDTYQFGMTAKWTTQGDTSYLEGRTLDGNHVSVTSNPSSQSELHTYVNSTPYPTTFPVNTYRCWVQPGETQWKLYKCTQANSAYWNFQNNLPIARP